MHDKYRLYRRVDRLVSPLVKIKDTVIITSFWRTGSSWFLEMTSDILGAKPAFEPFIYMLPNIKKVANELKLSDQSPQFLSSFMPYAPHPLNKESYLYPLVVNIMKGNNRFYYHIDQRYNGDTRRMLADCAKRRVVVKFTRGSLCVPAIAKYFGSKVIHISRSPLDVVKSISNLNKARWSNSSFINLDISKHLLRVEDGRVNYFDKYRDLISYCDKRSDELKIALYYGLTEKYLIEHCRSKLSYHPIKYEELVNNPVLALGSMFDLKSSDDQRRIQELAQRRSTTDYNAGRQENIDTKLKSDVCSIFKQLGMDEYLAY